MSLRSYSFIIQHEILTWSVQLTLTPFFNIVKTMLVDPLAAAMCNAVLPFYKYKKVVPVTNNYKSKSLLKQLYLISCMHIGSIFD